MIREERDPGWWGAVLRHPAVAPHVLLNGNDGAIATMASDPKVKPWATEHGGFWFMQRDGLGHVYELHTMFMPEGWGKEVSAASKEAFSRLFSEGASVVFTWEVAGNRSSRPPLSHGWKPAGEFARSSELAADVRTWVLTQAAWDASPAGRRHRCRS